MASIEEAKQIIKDTPISSVLGLYIPLNRQGGDFKAICPFHADTKPSMSVSDKLGIYKCFSCGAAGDSIKFVQDKFNLDFIDAVKDISNRLGITVEDNPRAQDQSYQMGLRVLKAAHRIYQKFALENKPKGFTEFLIKRKLNDQIVEDFSLCFSPANNALTNYLGTIENLQDRKKAIEMALKVGIIKPSKNGQGHYDFFRDRVMFPVWDHSGTLKGFSSRAIRENQNPKYLNSIESDVFNKRNILYGFNFAKSHIRNEDSAIIAEGHMDAVVLHQFGFKNSVATQGTAISDNACRTIANLTKNVLLAMDSDNAGIQAMERTSGMFMKLGIIPKFISFSPAKDPDEFLQEFGRIELAKRIDEAQNCLDYSLNKLTPSPLPDALDIKIQILNAAFKVISPLEDGLLAKERIIKYAKSLGLKSSAEDITESYIKYLDKNPSKKVIQDQPSLIEREQTIVSQTQEKPTKEEASQQLRKVDRVLIEQLISQPQALLKDEIAEILDLIGNSEVQRFITWVKEIYLEIDELDYISVLKDKLDNLKNEDLKNIIATSMFTYKKVELDEKGVDKLLKDLITRYKTEDLRELKQSLKQKQKVAEDQQDAIEYLKQIQEVERQLLELKKNK